ncbi:MAG TPA: tRNA (5-methylaminomethyl-2-thiouridine)(34)-methyltransferase MnmD [Bacteroidales bacterium]|jgi:tRNA U34 5-methylaminomethyl-2-thiouridine-forming methyltransferase MnmC|nr:tRNA (5-methylaminomethyl-2-thiouridine)(34)-methyltransferase MnmD [Bacteroidales bacterium]
MNIIITGDGSHTILVPGLNEHYHSTFGAITESKHIFLNTGLKKFTGRTRITIFEVGFGTGLNAFLTCIEAKKLSLSVEYHSLEKYPLEPAFALSLNYPSMIDSASANNLFRQLHSTPWDEAICINENFKLHKIKADLTEYEHKKNYDLVYFDAFGPDKQPELWTAEIFTKIYRSLNKGSMLVTYSVKGEVRRALSSAGFIVEKLPGPEGKREILRAVKV